MNENLNQVSLRILESKTILKKYPDFKTDLMKIKEIHKLQSVQDMMAIYKVQHTI